MPRESVQPESTREHVSQLPTVEVGWMRDGMSVQIGLETGARQDGQRHLVDYLYGDHQDVIGRLLLERFHANGWELAYRADAEKGRSLPPQDATAGSDQDVVLLSELGRDVLDAVTGSGADLSTGWYTHLSRAGCNRLIVLIRKARDAAFGRDA